MEEENNNKRKFPSVNPLFAAIGLLIVASLSTAGFFYYKYQGVNKLLKNNGTVSAEEAKKITDKISKFYQLPSGEDPNVATVLDITKLKDQPFFANAKNDDKVLIYAKAGLAILYRPSDNKIINVAPVTGAPSPTPEAQQIELLPTSTPKATKAPVASPEPSPAQ